MKKLLQELSEMLLREAVKVRKSEYSEIGRAKEGKSKLILEAPVHNRGDLKIICREDRRPDLFLTLLHPGVL